MEGIKWLESRCDMKDEAHAFQSDKDSLNRSFLFCSKCGNIKVVNLDELAKPMGVLSIDRTLFAKGIEHAG